jgi:hypothetical protein
MTTTVRLLANVGEDLKGAVLRVSQDRAQRLLRTGYAEVVEEPERPAKRKGKE